METFIERIEDNVMKDYKCFSSPAKKLSERGRRSGGIVCCIKDKIVNFFQPLPCQFDYALAFKISRLLFSTDKDIVLVCVYIPPAGSPYYNLTDYSNGIMILEQCLLQLLSVHADCLLMICGDLNARTGKNNVGDFDVSDPRCEMIDVLRESKDDTVNDFGNALLSLCSGLDLCIVNGNVPGDMTGGFTFMSNSGNSVVDYFLVSKELLACCKSLNVKANVLTAHASLELCLESKCSELENSDRTNYTCSRLVWDDNLKDVFVQNLDENTERIDNYFQTDIDVNVVAEVFTECYVKAAEPLRKTFKYREQRNVNDWFDRDCYLAKRQLRTLLHRYTRTMAQVDKGRYAKQRNIYKDLLREKKRLYRSKIVSSLMNCVHDSSLFWRQVKTLNRKVRTQSRISNEVWCEHFCGIFQQSVHDKEIESGVLSACEESDTLNADISVEEVERAIGKLKSRKASGHDEVLAEMLKCTSRSLVSCLTELFNAMFDKGVFPTIWNTSVILPIYKRGDPSIPDNYRGISLNSTFSKVFASILCTRIQEWAEDGNVIGEEQAGFRSGYSTLDNVFTLHAIIQRYLSRHKKMYVCFVDYRKAFDSVNRDVLWKVLSTYGINGRLLQMLKAIYSDVICCVKGNEGYSDSFACGKGLKQGCKMSPVIFSLLVNYVAKYVIRNGKHGVQLMPDVATVYLLLFADDIALMSDTVVGLQNQVNNLKQASDVIGLEVNVQKTKIVIFRNGGYIARHEKWFLGRQEIEIVNEFKYLGVLFTSRLSFNALQQDLAQRARAALLQVNRCIRKLVSVPPDVYFKLFDAQVLPVLLYSSELWGLTDNFQVENVHLQALKRFLNVPIRAPNVIVYGETGRYPLYINASIRAVKYWLKVLSMEENRFPKKIYRMMCVSGNSETWATRIKNLLYRYDLGSIWENQSNQTERDFLQELKKRMLCEYRYLWSDLIVSSNRYNFYRIFKPTWGRENYLFALDKKVFRDVFVNFRIGFSELFVHRLRFAYDIENDTMLCPACFETEEDEAHFLLECPVYHDLREIYMGKLTCAYDVQCIMSSDDEKHVRQVSMYLYYAFQRRREAVGVAMSEAAFDV